MAVTFLVLLTAHLLADFALQPDWMIRAKTTARGFFGHLLVVAMAVVVLSGRGWSAALVVTVVSHAMIDGGKLLATGKRWGSEDGRFLVDQAAHLAVAGVLAMWWPDLVAGGWWQRWLPEAIGTWYPALLSLVSGMTLVVFVGGVVIRFLTRPLLSQIGGEGDGRDGIGGLVEGGKYIGWLERFLVAMLVGAGQPAGVGFIVAAKSVFRFGDLKDDHQRKVTEYVMIGTFLSFGWGFFWAVLTRAAVQWWLA